MATGEKQERICQIIAREWEMFQAVHNVGGRASCQDDRQTFEIMRTAQFETWSPRCLDSYLRDLEEARENGQNLPELKYAYMMESTWPAEYAAIQDILPPVSEKKRQLAVQIGAAHLRWSEACAAKYPHLAGNGRPIHTSEDTPAQTSSQTYLRGELYTYSERTLALYLQDMEAALSDGINLCERILDNEVRAYGYASAQDYEERCGR